MKISTLSEHRSRNVRLSFTRYLVTQYGMNQQTAYGKLRTARVKKWEISGIERCIRQFAPDYQGEMKDFYSSLSKKTEFCQYMNDKMEMSIKTVSSRFRRFDFTKIELDGLESIYHKFENEEKMGKSA